MAVTPSGMFSLPLANTETLLASLAAFQTWTATATAAAAKGHIYLTEFDDPAQGSQTDAQWQAARAAYRPLCVIGFADNVEGEEDSVSQYWHKTGSMTVLFEEIAQNESGVAAADNPVTTKDAITHLMNHVGAIIEEMEAAVTGGGYADLVGWNLKENPGRMPEGEVSAGQLDIVAVVFQFNWRDL